MGFLDAFRKKPQALAVQELKFQDILPWARKQAEAGMGQARKRAEDMCSTVISRLNQVTDRVKRLEEKQLEGSDRVMVAANMVKASYVKKAAGLEMPEPLPSGPAYSDITGFHDAANKYLDGLEGTTPKQAIVLTNYFAEDGKAVIEGIKEARAAMENFRIFLDNDAKVLAEYERLESLADRHASLLRDNTAAAQLAQAQASEIGRLRKDLAKANEDLARLEKDEAYVRLQRAQEKLAQLAGAAESSRAQASALLSSYERPLKKLAYLAAREGRKDAEQEINGFLKSDPAAAGTRLPALLQKAKSLDMQKVLTMRELAKLDGLAQDAGALDGLQKAVAAMQSEMRAAEAAVQANAGILARIEAARNSAEAVRQKLQALEKDVADAELAKQTALAEAEQVREESRKAAESLSGRKLRLV
ncbi:MAG: hypothetical protein HY519_00530 [Candidatus Aenigmarchaeota archaeon]|nr:hypothetical protein [Candidatus Aenigmarchaeota archaeon]